MSEILIDNDISIETIQDGFRKQFPFLKLIFYKTAHETAALRFECASFQKVAQNLATNYRYRQLDTNRAK